jgi:hypothetical protein
VFAVAPGLPCHKSLMELIEILMVCGFGRGRCDGDGLLGTPIYPSLQVAGNLFNATPTGDFQVVPDSEQKSASHATMPVVPDSEQKSASHATTPVVPDSKLKSANNTTTQVTVQNLRASPLFALATEITHAHYGLLLCHYHRTMIPNLYAA